MKKYLFLLLLLIPMFIYAAGMDEKLSGRILLQVEDEGQAWYVEPETGERAFLGRPQDAPVMNTMLYWPLTIIYFSQYSSTKGVIL